MPRCKSCGAPIVWVKTYNGKQMPCDPGWVPFWAKLKAKGKVIDKAGNTVSCLFDGDPNEISGVGRIPHWATCPNAAQHKRKK